MEQNNIVDKLLDSIFKNYSCNIKLIFKDNLIIEDNDGKEPLFLSFCVEDVNNLVPQTRKLFYYTIINFLDILEKDGEVLEYIKKYKSDMHTVYKSTRDFFNAASKFLRKGLNDSKRNN